jgi:hypothetical protein
VTLPDALLPYRCETYSWERFREDEINGIEPTASEPERQLRLRQHQMDCVRALRSAVKAGRSGFLVADDVGLGKTIETWASIMSMRDAETVLIVCPLAVIAHWRRTIRWMGDCGKKIVVINYDRLKRLFEIDAAAANRMASRRRKPGRRVRTQKGIARFGDAAEFDVVVWDECHRLRRRDTARSKLAQKISDEAGFEFWLSATAGQDPLELEYLSPLLAEAGGQKRGALKNYAEWCRSQGIGVICSSRIRNISRSTSFSARNGPRGNTPDALRHRGLAGNQPYHDALPARTRGSRTLPGGLERVQAPARIGRCGRT